MKYLLAIFIYFLEFLVFLNFVNALAFPGAEGHGALSTGGRGGDVIMVTNLNNAGAGSFRAALTASGARTVVFNISGTITLESSVTISNSNITIAGQTAPGEGITLRRPENEGGGVIHIDNGVSDVIIRYIRIRSGNGTAAVGDNIRIGHSERVIIDHVSLSWSNDENLGVNCLAAECYIKDMTVQNSIISEALMPHSTATLISGKWDYCLYDPTNLTCILTTQTEY